MDVLKWAKWLGLAFVAGLAVVVALVLLVRERPQIATAQKGFRGTAMAQIDSVSELQANAALHAAPEIARPARVRDNAPLAGATYKNVQVLGELTIGEFGRTMNAITAWVAPKQSCAHCHVEGNFASDDKYTKIVARRMIQMVRHLNADWQAHVANTGVTCYTCHRGNPVPANVWFRPAPLSHANNLLFNRSGQNAPAAAAGLTSLPSDPFSDFLWQTGTQNNVRVNSATALPTQAGGQRATLLQTEHTYGLMVHVSKSLGVNCTFCHNTRAFASWPQSPIQRTTAWHGIRMVRDLNSAYLDPLTPHFPAVPVGRLGPGGDAAKIHCATCHQGANKPLYGAQTARYYPALWLRPQPDVAKPVTAPAGEAPASAPAPGLPASAIELLAKASAPAPASAATAAPAPPPATAATQVAAAPLTPAPEAPAAGTDTNCVQLAASATRAAMRIAEMATNRQVSGPGRLQFHAAPDEQCRMQGVFILPGEPVEADRETAGFTLVWYRNPRTGGEANGWVRSNRLQQISADAAKALLAAGAAQAGTAPPAAPAAVAATPAAAVPPAAAARQPASAAPAATAAPTPPTGRAATAAGNPPAAEATAAAATLGSDADCIQLALNALEKGKPVPASASGREVVGAGRLQFHAAPDAACRMQGVFILPGEPVEADREQAGYTAVWYRNPRTGADATGWVRSNRLGPGAAAATQRP